MNKYAELWKSSHYWTKVSLVWGCIWLLASLVVICYVMWGVWNQPHKQNIKPEPGDNCLRCGGIGEIPLDHECQRCHGTGVEE